MDGIAWDKMVRTMEAMLAVDVKRLYDANAAYDKFTEGRWDGSVPTTPANRRKYLRLRSDQDNFGERVAALGEAVEIVRSVGVSDDDSH